MNPNDPNDAYHLGFAAALLYAQAYNDTPKGQQTLTTHLPKGGYEDGGIPFSLNSLLQAIDYLNDECRCNEHRLGKDQYGSDTIEIASSEGHFGWPDWV